ncbi:MAG TPA: HEPN domain-containing protein [Pelobium sp.]|nr:HEPN domain-containing protein [Pelobium sp.]
MENLQKVPEAQSFLWELYRTWITSNIGSLTEERQQEMNKSFGQLMALASRSAFALEDDKKESQKREAGNVRPGLPLGVADVAELIVRTMRPERIFLIPNSGARAYEMIVIVPVGIGTKFAELEPYLEFAAALHPHIGCTLYSSGRLSAALREGVWSFLFYCTREHLIYDNGRTPFPKTDMDGLLNFKEEAKRRFKSGQLAAIAFYTQAELCFQRHDFTLAIFMLHQATELTLRALVTAFNGGCQKTHSIRTLKKHVQRIAPEISQVFPDDTQTETVLLDILESAYVRARYDAGFRVSEAECRELYGRADKIQDLADEAFDAHIRLLDIAE